MDKEITSKSENPKPAIKVENARPVDYAIQVNGVSKTFRIPHEKISSLRGAFVNLPAMLCGALRAGLFRTNGYEEFEALDACPVKFGAIARYLTGGVSFEVHPVKSTLTWYSNLTG